MSLSKEDIELWKALEDECGGKSLLNRIPMVTPSYLEPYHLRPLADAAARIRQGEEVRILLSVPPRHAKTETILNIPAWLWERGPSQVVYATAAADLARAKSRIAQRVCRDTGWKVTGTQNNWHVDNNGSFRGVGVGGQLTGHGANLLIVDDPFKDRMEAESSLIRDNVYDWFTSVAETRVEPRGSVIVVHTRWHDDDLIGRLRDLGGYEYVNLPAIVGSNNDLAALWPERWSLEALLEKQRRVGAYDWASLYMGEPVPKGGRLFNEPARYTMPNVEGAIILGACDPAASSKTRADNSAIAVGAFHGSRDNLKLDLLNVWAGQVELPDLCQRIVHTAIGWGCPIGVETAGAFKGIPQTIRRINSKVRIFEITPVADKFTRAQPCSAAWNSGRVRLPATDEKAPWLTDFLKEVRTFTGVSDRHDDQVDALVHLWNSGLAAASTQHRGNLRGRRIGAFA